MSACTYLSRRLAIVSRSDKKLNQVETDAEWVRCFNSTLNACIRGNGSATVIAHFHGALACSPFDAVQPLRPIFTYYFIPAFSFNP